MNVDLSAIGKFTAYVFDSHIEVHDYNSHTIHCTNFYGEWWYEFDGKRNMIHYLDSLGDEWYQDSNGLFFTKDDLIAQK